MKLLGTILFLIMFLVWAYLMKKDYLKKYDDKVYQKIVFSDAKTLFYRLFTNLACTPYFVLICIFMIILLENKKLAFIISIMMIIDAFLVFIFKHIFRRERPTKKRLVREKGYSFPSGHTFSATCFYGFLFTMASGCSIYLQLLFLVLYILLVVLIARSRIYLGVHYFSDVVAGFLLSVSYLLLYVYLVYDVLNLL